MYSTADIEFCRELPKAELHLHLEGAVDPGLLSELAPGLDAGQIRLLYHCSDFPSFLQCFKQVNERLRTPEAYALVTRRLLERLHGENVLYAEIIVSAGVVLWKGSDFAPIFDAIESEAACSPVKVRWIFDAVRHFGAEHVKRVAELAADRTGRGVVALGIGGDEGRGPAAWFKEAYLLAAECGLHRHAHAGETEGPASIWAALELGAERIGHGIRAIEDPVLISHLRDHQIPLEISLTSNLATGVVSPLQQHPVRRLFEAGIPITLNTDDPGIFNTSLSAEFGLAARVFGFSRAELQEIAGNAFRFAFDTAEAAAPA